MDEKIIAALSPLGYPVVPQRYTGEETTCLTFTYGTQGALFADDAPLYDLNLVQIHLLAPYGWDSADVRKQIKRRLFAAGFTWPVETDASDARQTENTGQHIVFQCETEEAAQV